MTAGMTMPLALALSSVVLALQLSGASAKDAPAPALDVAKFTSDGRLVRPQDLESWVFVGSSLGMGSRH